MKTDWTYRRGDIYLANLNPFKGSEQGGKRPVVVLQNNTGNLHSSTIIVATMTSHTDKKRPADTLYPTAGRKTQDGIGGAAGTDQNDRQMPGDEIFRKDPGGAYEGNQQNHKDQHGDHENPEGADDRTGGKEQCLKMLSQK